MGGTSYLGCYIMYVCMYVCIIVLLPVIHAFKSEFECEALQTDLIKHYLPSKTAQTSKTYYIFVKYSVH